MCSVNDEANSSVSDPNDKIYLKSMGRFKDQNTQKRNKKGDFTLNGTL